MTPGRPPSGPKIVESLDAAEFQKLKLRLILETIAGTKTIESASSELTISPTRFYEIRTQALQAAIDGLEPRPLGRPSIVPATRPAEVQELKQRVNRLEIELEASRVREEIALVMPHVLAPKKRQPTLTSVRFSRRRKGR